MKESKILKAGEMLFDLYTSEPEKCRNFSLIELLETCINISKASKLNEDESLFFICKSLELQTTLNCIADVQLKINKN